MNLSLDLYVPPAAPSNTGTYQCKVCGEQHASDDQDIWCAIAKRKADAKETKEA